MNCFLISITDCGAVPNGSSLQTAPIQSAIDRCFNEGGGEVAVPRGVFLTGGIRLRSGVTLHLLEGAVLRGSGNPQDYFGYVTDSVEPLPEKDITGAPYIHLSLIKGETAYAEGKTEYDFKRKPGSRWNNALIRAIHAENVSIIGDMDSVIDGANCYDAEGEENYRGPHAITFFDCRNVTLRGYTVINSANWSHNMLFCSNICCEGITVLAGHDGFDAAVCDNVVIRNSAFYTGDDSIAGFGNTNVYINGCELNSACSAMRFGGTNVLVEKCHIFGPAKYLFRGSLSKEERKNPEAMPKPGAPGHRYNMLSAFTYYGDYSLPIPQQPGNIVITDCRIENADRFLHYNYSGNELWQKHRPLDSITFRNIEAVGIKMPLTFYSSAETPASLRLENITAVASDEFNGDSFIRSANFKLIALENVNVSGLKCDRLIKTWTPGDIRLQNVNCGIPPENYVTETKEDFICKAI